MSSEPGLFLAPPPVDDPPPVPPMATETDAFDRDLSPGSGRHDEAKAPDLSLDRGRSRLARFMTGLLLALVGVGVSAVLLAPVLLSSRDLLDWGASPAGVGLPGRWPFLVILALDAPAIVFVCMSVLSTWRGERPGIFSILIWVFALASAAANWRHAETVFQGTGFAPDAPWFIPATSLTGPGILDVVLSRIRSWIRPDTTRPDPELTTRPRSVWAWQRWVPGLGSVRESLGIHRTRLLLALPTRTEAAQQFHTLCPDGSLRVGAALRRRYLADAQARDLAALGVDPAGRDRVDPRWPVDLMRRIPVDPDAYARWRAAWHDLAHVPTADTGVPDAKAVAAVAKTHHVSSRYVQFVRRAGQLGLLDSPTPPAVRLAALAARETTTRNGFPSDGGSR